MRKLVRPSSRAVSAGNVSRYEHVTVLGETRDHWYYIRMDRNVTGYVQSSGVTLGSAQRKGDSK
ncbi:MAG: SH3 domain-containing protein [Oscillospiraceae bacterium]|jgi:uncharacterized protein YgiM (DUF1202 family)|nr:SH3 domain-containing protein [Oscillospiraceae bacterium]